MVFRTRNCYYLRISEKAVLPLYLYLDERHVDWMSDLVLQHVLSDLRPRILPKLQMEVAPGGGGPPTKKASSVDTHRGDTYQFCYFIRSVEPHSILIKSRSFVALPPRKVVTQPVPSFVHQPRGAKRKAPTAKTKKVPQKKKPRKGMQRALSESDDDDEDDIYVSDTSSNEIEMQEDEDANDLSGGRDVFDIEIEEEEKPKPLLQLNYRGFGIYGKCLCVVVEPWPLLPKAKVPAPPREAGDSSRLSVPPRPARGETPLFLPDDTEQPELPDVPLYTMDEQESDDDNDPFSNVMAFSQVLANMGDNRPGAAADDEDMDTAVFFGDADEAREL